ncbi:MAG: VF530 family protein [Legionellaceae bacterium]|nr:VF530 family protein [Legionellaceae bacterium]
MNRVSTVSNDPLHGITLKTILNHLLICYGWEGLAERIHINCFHSNPSINSSLKFLRKTPWARAEVETLYRDYLNKKNCDNASLQE